MQDEYRIYIEKEILFEFEGTTGEIADHILANRPDIGEELERLIAEGKTPTIDRIDASKGYNLDNIQILDRSANSRDGARNAIKKYMQEIKIQYDDGRVVIAESQREASRIIGCNHASLHNAIKRGGRMPKFGCTVALTDNAKNVKLPPVATSSKVTVAKYAKALSVTFTDNTVRSFESRCHMSRELSIPLSSIRYALKNTGRMPKYNVASIEYI